MSDRDEAEKQINDLEAEVERLQRKLTEPREHEYNELCPKCGRLEATAQGQLLPNEARCFYYCRICEESSPRATDWQSAMFLWRGGGPTTISDWQRTIHAYAKDKGWWDSERPRSFGDICALFHSEISEAYEEFRAGRAATEVYESPNKPGKPEGIPVEIADLVIRVLDWCEHEGIDLQGVMATKHKYNKTREHRHGGKRT